MSTAACLRATHRQASVFPYGKNHRVHISSKKGNTFVHIDEGGTTVTARELNVDEHLVVKTLVMETDNGDPLLILMHGNKQVSTKALARTLEVKTVKPCEPLIAHKHTGYFVGGISPFGTRKSLKVYVEASIMEFPTIYINAGKKGLLAKMSPGDLKKILNLIPVSVAI